MIDEKALRKKFKRANEIAEKQWDEFKDYDKFHNDFLKIAEMHFMEVLAYRLMLNSYECRDIEDIKLTASDFRCLMYDMFSLYSKHMVGEMYYDILS